MYMKKDHSLKRKQLNYKKSRYNTKIVKLHFQKITLYIIVSYTNISLEGPSTSRFDNSSLFSIETKIL